jgi:F5/8 type C domain
MGLAVVTVASGGMPVVEVAAFGLPVTEAAQGIAVTKMTGGKPGLGVTFVSATGPGPVVQTHRYWRLYITQTLTNNSFNIAEVELRSTAGGADQTGSGTASASPGTPTGGVPANCFDNNATTTFHSPGGSMPAWLIYDFGAATPKDIMQVMIQAHPSNAGYSPIDFEVQFSDDNSVWTKLWGVTGSTGWAAGEIRVFTKP